MTNLPWWAVALIFVSFVSGMLRRGGDTPAEADVSEPVPDTTDADFAIYQRRLASQSRRLDGLDAGLIALAALQLGAMLYIGVSDHGESWVFKVGAGIIAACIGLDLIAVIGYEGTESPDLATFEATVAREGRPAALREAMAAMVKDHTSNNGSIIRKQRVTRWGALVSGVIVLATVLWRLFMVH